MQASEYQSATAKTAIYPTQSALAYLALGLAGEAGEVAGKVSKVIRDNNGNLTSESNLQLKKEVGDCLWFISQLCNEYGWTLEELFDLNISKLFDRQKRGVLGGSGDNR